MEILLARRECGMSFVQKVILEKEKFVRQLSDVYCAAHPEVEYLRYVNDMNGTEEIEVVFVDNPNVQVINVSSDNLETMFKDFAQYALEPKEYPWRKLVYE